MMTCEKGLQKHITYAKDSHVMKLLDDKAEERELVAIEQAPVSYLDYQQVNVYISRFFQAGNAKDRNFYFHKLKEIDKVYGRWLEPRCKDKLKKALKSGF